jgi:hypothetical protein
VTSGEQSTNVASASDGQTHMSRQPVEVRSYRTVFELERRLYRIDRFRLNPAGVPLRGVVYFALAVIAIAAAQTMPAVGWALRELPWYLRYVGLPLGTAALLTIVRVDGRPVHLALRAVWRGPRATPQLNGLVCCPPADARWRPPPLLLVPDGSDPWVRGYRFRGPGAVMIRVAHEPPTNARPHSARRARGRSAKIVLRAAVGPRPPSARVVSLRAGATLVVESGTRPRRGVPTEPSAAWPENRSR